MSIMRSTLLAAGGGVAGATVRWGVGETITPADAGFPWHTFLVNLTGCLLIGVAARRLRRGTDAWYGVVTGFLSGLTTFSAFADETRMLVAEGRGLIAAAYVTASVVGGVAAVEIARSGRWSAS